MSSSVFRAHFITFTIQLPGYGTSDDVEVKHSVFMWTLNHAKIVGEETNETQISIKWSQCDMHCSIWLNFRGSSFSTQAALKIKKNNGQIMNVRTPRCSRDCVCVCVMQNNERYDSLKWRSIGESMRVALTYMRLLMMVLLIGCI